MPPPRWNLAEFLLAITFLSLFAATVAKSWDGLLFLHTLAGTGILLFLGYCVLVLMIRQHRERNNPRSR
ncbi:MAG: hypothetical protein ABS79_01775 [Planctomycetes bacterium SCN 63-9]|nr:MAG: hypothetical protein ABS79_01775 [Planctomycetes bacterium SCN 63-9]